MEIWREGNFQSQRKDDEGMEDESLEKGQPT